MTTSPDDGRGDGRTEQGPEVEEDVAEEDPGWPWSFLLLVAAGALYLIFRFVELGIKLFS